MVVVSLCDRTGNMVKPWAEAGYECYCVDIRHPIVRPKRVGNISYCYGDVRTWCPPDIIRFRIGILFAFPPCTHVAISGARYFRSKGTAMLRDSLELFAACEHAAKWSGVPYMIENPVGKFSDHMLEPDITYQPWQYGDNFLKRTCLWVGNGFVIPEPTVPLKPANVLPSIWSMPDTAQRQDKRSETPMGFARAVFDANHPNAYAKTSVRS